MIKVFRKDARGKINLYLRVTGLREDGYHTLETVFQQVALCDNVSLTLHSRGGCSVRTNKRFLPTDGRNLAVRAAEAFFEAARLENPGLYINIRKSIPVGGGMAGGSTNAAAVLSLLNRAFGGPLSHVRLHELGLSLGADVPFCLEGGAALATGIGEVLQPIKGLPPCHLVLCRPAISVSTKTAFGLLDVWPKQTPPPVTAMVDALEAGNLPAVCHSLYNEFEGPIMDRWPELRTIREKLLENGAAGGMMTGTGSVIFGIFDTAEAAEEAAARLGECYREVFVTTP